MKTEKGATVVSDSPQLGLNVAGGKPGIGFPVMAGRDEHRAAVSPTGWNSAFPTRHSREEHATERDGATAFPENSLPRRKITVVTLLTCGVVLLAAMGALFSFHLTGFHENFTRELTRDLVLRAEGIADNSAAALASKDRKTAGQVLAALQASPHVRAAWIQLPDGSEFARFGAANREAGRGPLPERGFRFEGDGLLLGQPIRLGAERLGTLYLRSDYRLGVAQFIQLNLGTLAAVLGIWVLLAWLLSVRLQRWIAQPVRREAESTRPMARPNDPPAHAPKMTHDESAAAPHELRQMLAQIQAQDAALLTARRDLEKQVAALQHEIIERKRTEEKVATLHKQWVDASRQAGMAEVATGVLHNVGNVLNSMNVSVTLMREHLRKSRAANLIKVVELFRKHRANLGAFITSDPKGKMVPAYLEQLAAQLVKESNDALQVVELVTRSMEHIKKIVAMQQSYGKAAGVPETLPAATLIEDALQINAAALDRHGIKVVCDYADVPPVTVDKHKVLQILINLVRNAKYALDESGREDKVVRLGISRNGNERLKITVADNGVGIKPENLTRIFAHGFTTRKDGHGFGLHSGALAARELGGSLTAHSDGPGRGALFTLELPFGNVEGHA